METRAEYALTPTYTPQETALDDQESYTSSEIDKQRDRLAQAQEGVKEAQKELAEAKAQLKRMIEHANIPDSELRSWIFNMYWHTEGHTPALQALCKRRISESHQVWQELIEASAEWPCSQCGQKEVRAFASKSDLSRAKKVNGRYLCLSCAKQAITPQAPPRAPRRPEPYLDDNYPNTPAKLKALPYSEYLQTDWWQDVRRAALKLAGRTCQLCNATNTELHVHHKTYERVGNERPEDVIVLCASCHAKFHDKEPTNG